jgi:isopenicillin N synthase-like dioxygenase
LTGEQGNVPLFEEDAEKGLLTLFKSDKSGLQVRDLQGRWIVVDVDLGPHDMVLYSGMCLHQATGGYLFIEWTTMLLPVKGKALALMDAAL